MVADFKEKLPTGDGVILRETIGRHKPRKGNAAEEAEKAEADHGAAVVGRPPLLPLAAVDLRDARAAADRPRRIARINLLG